MKQVLFTQRVEIIESYGERRDCADQRIGEFIASCGFLPMALPNHPHRAEEIVQAIKPAGIVLTGGNSLVKYGGNAPERDATDQRLIKLAVEEGIPLYGFCRGMQSIMDYFGNELAEVSGHVSVRHKVMGEETSQEVNSYHNQGCLNLASEELEALLQTSDGVIEKVRHRSLPIIGTMWHPEREQIFSDTDMAMVRDLFGGNRS